MQPLPLSDDIHAKAGVAECIIQCFSLCKTYGKTAKDMETMAHGFVAMLGDYPAEKVKKAFLTHVKRSEELPTMAGIISLIERNGKPPMKESDVIAVRKKHGEDRTPDDWQLMRDWDAQRTQGWGDSAPEKQASVQDENVKLRQQAKSMQRQIDALMRHEYVDRKAEESRQDVFVPKVNRPFGASDIEARHERTIADMRKRGATDEDVAEYWACERSMDAMRGGVSKAS